MMPDILNEVWKTVAFDFEFTNQFRLEISNYGRVRSFNKISNGNILKGSLTEGYRVIRLKLYKPRAAAKQARFNFLQGQVLKLAKELKAQEQRGEADDKILGTKQLLTGLKKTLSNEFKADLKQRTMHHHLLIHRLVAQYFLPQPSPAQSVVAHLNYNKLDNNVTNLKWMTAEENQRHQQGSPRVLAYKQKRQHSVELNLKNSKLSVTKVMLLKKLINQGKPMKQLVKLFDITETQILRIKRGENWGRIPAAGS